MAGSKREHLRLFFDPFARGVELYYSRGAVRTVAPLAQQILQEDPESEPEEEEEELELDTTGLNYKADKTRAQKRSAVDDRAADPSNVPSPVRYRVRKAEVLEDLALIRKGTLGPHALVSGQTVAACVPYTDDDSGSGSDSEKNKERWVIAVVIAFDKKRKLYRVKDKYQGEHSGRGRPRAEVSWEVSPTSICRFPSGRHPKCKARDRILALWPINETSDSEGENDGEDEEWTSVFYDATVVDPEVKAGYIRIDYGGDSGIRTVRIDKVLTTAGRPIRRTEKDETQRKEFKDKDLGFDPQAGAKKKPKLDSQDPNREKKDKLKDKTQPEREKSERVKEKMAARNGKQKRRSFSLPEPKPALPLTVELLEDASLRYFESFLPAKVALELYEYLLGTIPWKEDSTKSPEKEKGTPQIESQFTVWFGENGEGYTPSTSSTRTIPDPWAAVLFELKSHVEKALPAKFNYVHLNYQDGADFVGPQDSQDDPKVFGRNMLVASMVLGCDSRFRISHREKPHKHDLTISSGGLFALEGQARENYVHTLPKIRGAAGRILVTFRAVLAPDMTLFMDVPTVPRKRKYDSEENGEPSDESKDETAPPDAEEMDDPTVPSDLRIGPVQGVAIGAKFNSRQQLFEANVHRMMVGTICGAESEGAESLLLVGAEQHVDNGSELYFSGAIMVVAKNRRKSPSSWKVLRGSQALIAGCIKGVPVRVIRSHRLRSQFAPTLGFSFDGMYKVSQFWEEPYKMGQYVWKFKLTGPMPVNVTRPASSLKEPSTGAEQESRQELYKPDSFPSFPPPIPSPSLLLSHHSPIQEMTRTQPLSPTNLHPFRKPIAYPMPKTPLEHPFPLFNNPPQSGPLPHLPQFSYHNFSQPPTQFMPTHPHPMLPPSGYINPSNSSPSATNQPLNLSRIWEDHIAK